MWRKPRERILNGQNNMAEIEGVVYTPLKQFIDERGAVYRVFRNYNGNVDVNEVYISRVNHGIVKGWKRHHKMNQRFVVPYGSMKLVLADLREDSPTKGNIMEVLLDQSEHYAQLVIPHGIWYSFGCMSNDYALMLNIADLIHEDNESDVLPLENDIINYNWK